MPRRENQTDHPASREVRGERDREPVLRDEKPLHPLATLQQAAGNRAVQRLVGGEAPDRAKPTLIQRHMAPGMAAIAMASQSTVLSTAGSLMLQGSETMIAGTRIQQAADQLIQAVPLIAAAIASSEALPAGAPAGEEREATAPSGHPEAR